jgi:Protein of unknown function (DUF3108)
VTHNPPSPHKPWALPLLVLAVTAVHLWLVQAVVPDSLGLGNGAAGLQRIDVAFVRDLTQTAPPTSAPRLAPAPLRAPAAAPPLPPAPAASSPVEALALATPPEPPPVVTLPQPRTEAPLPVPAAEASPTSTPNALTEPQPATIATTSTTAPADVAAPATPTAFEWPPSTRLSYTVTGNYRGPIDGQARVEWLRQGSRYQVFMDIGIGPSFAPLLSRRVSSQGDVTASGLQPSRYEETTRALLAAPRRLAVELDADRIRLANGTELPRPAGVQDSASQFVQLTWLFTTQPDLLQTGRTVDIPLALPRAVQVWTYDVIGPETLDTPAGRVDTLHVKPRREAKAGGDLTAEMWVAPSLQYLPVRIVIRQDAQNYLDLLIERLPQQAAPGR